MAAALRALLCVAGGVSVASGTKPVFDYVFGANSWRCADFGATLKKLYEADGIAAAVEFDVHADIYNQGTAGWHCPDEASTCPMTRWVLCALGANTTIDQRIAFLTCWDDSKGTSSSKVEACASKTSPKLDFATISACNSGPQGLEFMKTEAEYIVKRFTPYIPVPHIEVDKVAQWARDYQTILDDLCSKGIQAGACKKTVVV